MVNRTPRSAGLLIALLAGPVWLLAGGDGRPDQPAAVAAPPAPTAGATEPGSVPVRLRWDAVAGADVAEYLVSWGDGPATYTASRTVGRAETAIVLDLPRRAKPYYFAVQTRDTAGRMSGFSNEFAIDVSSGRATTWKPAVKQKPARVRKPKPPRPPKPPKPERTRARQPDGQ